MVLNGAKVNWLANCTWVRGLKYDRTEGRQEVWKLEEELDKDAVCHQFCSTCTANVLPREALEEFGHFQIGGQIIHTVKVADELVLLAKEEKVLQDKIDKLIEIWECYGMKMNVEKTKVMSIFRQPFPVKIMIDHK